LFRTPVLGRGGGVGDSILGSKLEFSDRHCAHQGSWFKPPCVVLRTLFCIKLGLVTDNSAFVRITVFTYMCWIVRLCVSKLG
jgi:hypothetical protein